VGGELKKIKEKNSKSDKTHPEPDWVSLSARSAFAVCANCKLGKNYHKQNI
jgi:hypothetical protein